jgi:FAR-17a/AIG1-like protein
MGAAARLDYRRPAVRTARLLFGLLGVATIATAAVNGHDLANFFSFFTIESNILAVVALLVGAVSDPRSERWAFFRGGATLYMVITGIVYAVLLAHQDVGLTTAWINDVLHRVMPLAMIADWALFGPWPRISYPGATRWLAVPAVYAVYSLIRGAINDWYPYPFLDPRHHAGYGRVAAIAALLAVVMALLAAVTNWIARRRSPRGAQTDLAR